MPLRDIVTAFDRRKKTQKYSICRFQVALVTKLIKRYWLDILLQPWLLKHSPKVLLLWSTKRINILFDSAFEEEGRLRNHRNVLSERVKTHLQSIVAANGVGRT